jgi:hypothetical protein
LDALVPWVVELGGEKYLRSWDTGPLDSLTDLSFVAISKLYLDQCFSSLLMNLLTHCSVNMSVSSLESSFHSVSNLSRLRLPSSETNSGDLCARVEIESLPVESST